MPETFPVWSVSSWPWRPEDTTGSSTVWMRGKKNGFQYRLVKEDICYEEAEENFFRFCAGQEELDNDFGLLSKS